MILCWDDMAPKGDGTHLNNHTGKMAISTFRISAYRVQAAIHETNNHLFHCDEIVYYHLLFTDVYYHLLARLNWANTASVRLI